MPFTGPAWKALANEKAPRVRDRELSWPRDLFTLEFTATVNDVPHSMGGAEQFALTTEQRDFVHACSFFVKVVKLTKQEKEFLGEVYSRFFALWPTPVCNFFGWNVAKRQEHVRLDLQWAALACPHFDPPVTWETFLALSNEDLRWAQDGLLAHEKETRRGNQTIAPRMRRETIYVPDSDEDEVPNESGEDEEESIDLEPLPPTAETPPRRSKSSSNPFQSMVDTLTRMAEDERKEKIRRAWAAKRREALEKDERPPAQ
ncbi:hypothetical protein MD484_g7186, partial [Candolleomyces efflorescens]